VNNLIFGLTELRGLKMTPDEIAKLDQSIEETKQYVLPALHSFYTGALDAGFDIEQAFELTREFFLKAILGR